MGARPRAKRAALVVALVAYALALAGCVSRSEPARPRESTPAPQTTLNDVVSMTRAYLETTPPRLAPGREPVATSEPAASAMATGAAVPSGEATPPAPPPARFIVVLDPGHQARADLRGERVAPWSSELKPRVTAGATGVTTGVRESALMLDIALRLEERLERAGVRVILTRTREDVNVSNRQRAEVANSVGAALLLRLHANSSSDPAAHGASVICQPARPELAGVHERSWEAGQLVLESFLRETGLANGGVTRRSDLTGLNWSRSPAILIEMGYLSNRSDEATLTSAVGRDAIVRGLAAGVLRFLATMQR